MDDTPWLDRPQLAAWVRLAALLELLPGVLDGQLRRDANLTMFEYFVLAMLSEAPGDALRMTELARQTNATPPRLSHVIRRLEARGLVERTPHPGDGKAIDAVLTPEGRARIESAAPGHVVNVRQHVIDALTPEQIEQFTTVADAILERVDPDGRMSAMYRRYDVADVS